MAASESSGERDRLPRALASVGLWTGGDSSIMFDDFRVEMKRRMLRLLRRSRNNESTHREDEADLASTLTHALGEAHLPSTSPRTGDRSAVHARRSCLRCRRARPDGAEATGWTLLQDFREVGGADACAVLTALDAVDDRVKRRSGRRRLSSKAVRHLRARGTSRALVRRSGGKPSPVLVVGDITIDRAARLVYRENVPVDLRHAEYSILS